MNLSLFRIIRIFNLLFPTFIRPIRVFVSNLHELTIRHVDRLDFVDHRVDLLGPGCA